MMRYVLVFLTMFVCGHAFGTEDLVLPTIGFSATAVHETGAYRSRETIHYANGKLRIDRGRGWITTILDLRTQTQYLLMVNHTFLVLPMDSALCRRYFAHTLDASGARRVGTARIEGLKTTKYAFGNDGPLDAAGSYWLTKTGVMVRRDYEDGVFGVNVHHLEFLSHIVFSKQPASLFLIPPGYKRVQ